MSDTAYTHTPINEAPAKAGASKAPLILVQRSGAEASWPSPASGFPKPPDFGHWPTSWPPPSRRHPVADLLVTGLIALLIVISAALYISGALDRTHHGHQPATPTDPFAVGR